MGAPVPPSGLMISASLKGTKVQISRVLAAAECCYRGRTNREAERWGGPASSAGRVIGDGALEGSYAVPDRVKFFVWSDRFCHRSDLLSAER